MPDVKWTDDRIQTAKELWRTHTAGQIGKKMGCSRNAVLGILWRAKKLRGHEVHIESRLIAPRIYFGAKIMKERKKPPTKPSRAKHPTMQCPCQLVELGEHQCHWPYGDPVRDPASFYFCGAIAVEGKRYCQVHLRTSFKRSEAAEQNVGSEQRSNIAA